MRKFLVALLLALMVATLLLAGCGQSESDKSAEEAKDILAKSQEKMDEVNSVKMTGSASVEMTEAEQGSTEYDFEAVTQKTPDGQTELQMIAKGDGEDLQTYVLGGYAYTYDSNSGWVKRKITGADGVSTPAPTPDQLSEMSRYAESLRLMPEEDGKYVVAFDVSPEFFDQYSEGLTESSGIMEDFLKDIKVSVIYKIDKSTMYADNVDVDISLEDTPLFGDITAYTSITFSEFNQPVTIVLPAEAQNAPEKELLPGDFDIPIPGMGF